MGIVYTTIKIMAVKTMKQQKLTTIYLKTTKKCSKEIQQSAKLIELGAGKKLVI